MYLQERQIKVLELIEEQGRVSVAQLSAQFQVSEVTIRNDLKRLAEQKLILRTHGGAVSEPTGLLSMALRQKRYIEEKNRIGKAAAARVAHGEAIFLDSSTTALAMTQHITDRQNLTVITNSLVVAEELLKASNIKVVLPGGVVQKDTVSIVDSDTLVHLQKYNISTGFFGAHGLSIKAGLTDVSHAEACLKQPVIELCMRVVAVVDASKWGSIGPASFAQLNQIDTVITDTNAPQDLVAKAQSLGLEVVIV